MDLASELERLIPEVMDEWQVPGLAIAVVQNDTVTFAKAYGWRDREAGLPAGQVAAARDPRRTNRRH